MIVIKIILAGIGIAAFVALAILGFKFIVALLNVGDTIKD
jgi:hypothetical protein